MAHGILSPSGYTTWGACPGSVVLCKDIVEEPSPNAEEGTKAHALACACGMARAAGEVSEPTSEDAEMLRCARGWANLTHERVKDSGGYGFEYRVNLKPVTGRAEVGTADFWALRPDGTLSVCDFKYGMGVRVDSERNGQLSIYAAALLAQVNGGINFDGKAKSVEILIYQPRIYSEPSIWNPGNAEFLRFVTEIKSRAESAAAELAKGASDAAALDLRPGEAQCRFCRAKPFCPALRDLVKREVEADFDVIPVTANPVNETDPVPNPQLPTPDDPEKLAKVLPWLDTIEKWCAACRAAAAFRIEHGGDVPGWKLVMGRKGVRKWSKGAEAAVSKMVIPVKTIYVKKLVSPTAMEKLARSGEIGPRQWEKIQKLIERGAPSKALVPASDPRPALLFSVADEFDVLPSPATAEEKKQEKQDDDPLDFI